MFGWVSRERFDDAVSIRDTRIAELSAQVKELTEERKLLSDFIATGTAGRPIYSKTEVVAAEPEKEPEIEDLPPTQARQFARSVERKNQINFAKDEAESAKLISDMQEAGRQAAEEAARSSRAQA